MSLELAEKPLVLFLKTHLQSLAAFFLEADMGSQALVGELRARLHEALYDEAINPHFRPFLLQSCAMIPKLGKQTLASYLRVHDLPAAWFLSEPADSFDAALVPFHEEAPGSGYVLYLTDSLTPADIYELLAHAYGHLAFGHLRRGDTHSHYDILDDLHATSGPARRWDQAIQAEQHYWFQALPCLSGRLAELEPEWEIPGFAQAFERLQREDNDDYLLGLQAFAARHGDGLPQVAFDLERDAELFPHQKRGAAELVVRLQKLGVALLADSVGLGKTRTVATTIKLLCQNHIIARAAVLAPAKLHHNWLAELQKLHLTVSTQETDQTDVLLINKDGFKRYDGRAARKAVQSCQLLVIEEAHQDMRNVGNKFHRNIREAALDKYGLLVTATPWNNRRGDIFSMLQPFASNRKGTDRPAHLFACFSKSLEIGQEEFEQDTLTFQQIYNRTTLQRTRRQLRQSGDTSVFYAPRRPFLVNVVYTSEQQQRFATLLEKIEQLHLPTYNPVRYVTTSDSSENRLSGIHRFQLLKRAESSMQAFALSLQNLANRVYSLFQELSAVDDSEAAIAAWLEKWYQIETTENQNELEQAQHSGESQSLPGRHNRIRKLIKTAAQEGRLRAMRTLLLNDCQQDMQLIQSIQQEFANLFARDPKLEMILQKIQESVDNGQKVLCISQYSDTAHAVYCALVADPFLVQKGVGFLTSSENGKYAPAQINNLAATREDILRRFAPRSWSPGTKHKLTQTEQHYPATIDILIGSDTLSVGQNLQDARVLLNLDLCWNPMQHEQRIGRIDRPRHKEDSELLDIYYFLNLELIEAELALRQTIEERLTSTYQDTAFDDEIFPGYFEMIEQFSRLRKEKQNDLAYIAEADLLLEEIAERSARPSDDGGAESELERKAFHHLQEMVHNLMGTSEPVLNRRLVSIGRIPSYDWQGSPYVTYPDAALVAEIRFQTLDQQKHIVGKANYQYVYVSLIEGDPSQSPDPQITLNDASFLLVVEGFLAERSRIPLKRKQIKYLQLMLAKLEQYAQQALDDQRFLLKRERRYQKQQISSEDRGVGAMDQTIEADLVNIRLLV